MIFLGFLVSGFEVKASLVSAGECDLVRVTGDGIPANDYVTVGIDLGAVDFHVVIFLILVMLSVKHDFQHL